MRREGCEDEVVEGSAEREREREGRGSYGSIDKSELGIEFGGNGRVKE